MICSSSNSQEDNERDAGRREDKSEVQLEVVCGRMAVIGLATGNASY